MKFRYCLFFLLIMFITPSVYAACIKNTPLWGTGDTKETCRYKMRQKAQIKQIELEATDQKIARQRYNLNNGITGNNNVVLGLGGLFGGNQQDKAAETGESLVLTKHQIRVEIMGFLKADSAYFNTPKAPDAIFFNGAAWEYYVSPNMGFGVLWQQYSLSGATDFDVIKDNSGDVLFFPGNVTKGEYLLILPYVTFNGLISNPWHWAFQIGVGSNTVKLETKEIDVRSEYREMEQRHEVRLWYQAYQLQCGDD